MLESHLARQPSFPRVFEDPAFSLVFEDNDGPQHHWELTAHWHDRGHSLCSYTISWHPQAWILPALESVTFLLKGSCEIITVRVDTEAFLNDAGYFAYSLDLFSKASKEKWEHLGLELRGIFLAQEQGLGFWQQMVDWKTHSWWEWQKKAICAGNDKINANWFAANQLKASHEFDSIPKSELVEPGAREMFMERLY
jgi:hypothetical protein